MHPHAGEQQRFAQRRAGDDTAARYQRGGGQTAAADLVVHEFRRWRDLAKSPDRPVAVVQIELRHDIGQVDIGGPIGIDRADVAPIGGRLGVRADAGALEAMRHRFAVLDDVRNNVLAEVVARVLVGGIAAQFLEQEFGVEHIDAHRRQRHVRLVRHGRRILGLFDERQDLVVVIDIHHAKAGCLLARHFQAADRDVGALVHVLLQHLLVVHLVDVVAREQHDELRVVALDDVDVLIDRVGRAEIPELLGDALARRQNVKALVALRPEEVPAVLQMADQAVRLVLGGDRDAADAGIQRIGQREVDDPRLAAKIHGRLGAAVGQLHQSAATASCQHISHRVTSERGINYDTHPSLS